MEIAIFCLFCGIATAVFAAAKHRGGWKWFLLGVLFGPFALLAVGFMPKVEAADAAADTRECPHCARSIEPEALVCKHCGGAVPPEDPDPK